MKGRSIALKRTRLRAKGGSRFPKRRDPHFMAWLKVELLCGHPCDAECGRMATDRAHLKARGSGGDDRGNVVLLCRSCHEASEKRVDQFNAERGVDLQARAARWVDLYAQDAVL